MLVAIISAVLDFVDQMLIGIRIQARKSLCLRHKRISNHNRSNNVSPLTHKTIMAIHPIPLPPAQLRKPD